MRKRWCCVRRTTWIQQIVAQLVFDGAPEQPLHELSLWVDFRFSAEQIGRLLSEQTHRRFMKTHLPRDAMVLEAKAKYIYVARDGRDVVLSMHNHHAGQSPEHLARMLPHSTCEDAADAKPANPDVGAYFDAWLAGDGYPWWPYWENVRTWWEARNQPNVLLVHYADLKMDLQAQIETIANFLNIDVDVTSRTWHDIVAHSSLAHMQENAQLMTPMGGRWLRDGPRAFLPSGRLGAWRDVLTAQQSEAYSRRARDELGAECAAWLELGLSALRP